MKTQAGSGGRTAHQHNLRRQQGGEEEELVAKYVRMPRWLFDALKALAVEQGLSMNAVMVTRLKRSVEPAMRRRRQGAASGRTHGGASGASKE